MKKILTCFVAALAICCSMHSIQASAINFGPAQTFTGPADAQTAGLVVVKAYDFDAGATPLSINGVTFTDFNNQVADTHTGLTGTNVGYGTDGFSGGYGTMLNAGDYQDGNGNQSTITLNGLTSGKTYQIELWVSDGRGCCTGRSETFTGDLPGTNGTVAFGGGSGLASDGQFVIGTFVASGTSQLLDLDSGNQQINGLLLGQEVPEPSSIVALCGLGLAGLVVAIRRRRSKS